MTFNPKSLFHIIPPAFGLDISDTSLKFVQFKVVGRELKLQTYGERDLKPGIIESGAIKKPKQLITILHEALSKEGLPSYVVVSLPGESIFLSMIQLPQVNKAELGGAVQVEAEAHIPIDLADAYWDYHVLPGERQGNIFALVAAAQKRIVDIYLKVLLGSGLSVLAIEPESMAIARVVIKGGMAKKPVLIVEIGANRTRLIVFLADAVAFVGSVPFSSMIGARVLAQKLKVEISNAHQLQWEAGLEESADYGDTIAKILAPLLDTFAQQINRYISFFNTHKEKNEMKLDNIGSVFLSGGGSRMPGIDEYLTSQLNLPVKRANPWVNIQSGSSKREAPLRYEQSLRYATALGLALRASKSDLGDIFN